MADWQPEYHSLLYLPELKPNWWSVMGIFFGSGRGVVIHSLFRIMFGHILETGAMEAKLEGYQSEDEYSWMQSCC